MSTGDLTLTKRQRQILLRFIEGRSIISIATELRCSEWTVRAHLKAIADQIESPYTPMRRLLVYGASLLAEGS
jgi:DNA-binding CsgD family transcriptional regulator